MDAITFVSNFYNYVEDIEKLVKPEFYPAIRAMYRSDPHDFIRPDAIVIGNGKGLCWEIFVKECKKQQLL